MRVLHVIPSVAVRDGGPAVAIREMASALARSGVSVTVATTDADGPLSRLDVPTGRPIREAAVDWWHFRRSLPGEWKFSIGLARWLFGHARTFDAVHVHALFSFATIPGCRAARRAQVPYVLRPLGTLDPWSLHQKVWKKRPYYRLVERSHLVGAAAVHVTSASEADAVRRLGFDSKASVIPLGVPAPVVTRRHEDREPVRLLFLSRLHPKKNIELLLGATRAAATDGRRLELTIAGAGDPGYEAELRSTAERLASDRASVRFVGQVGGRAKERLLAGSDVFVLPSKQENFGIAVAEALAAGLPVIVSDQVAIASDVAAAGAGRVVPQEVGALAAAIRALAADVGARQAMGERGIELARERYSWDSTAAALRSLYASIITKAHGSR